MNNTAELAAEWRTVHGKQVRQLRRKGLVPAILYGHGPSTPLQVDGEAVQQILRRKGPSVLLKLKIRGGETASAVIKQLQFDPVSGDLLHVDFLRAIAQEKLKTRVPLRFVGEPKVAETHDVAIVKRVEAVTVESYPEDLPAAVEADLGQLEEPHDTIRVADLDPGEGVRIVDQPDEVVAGVAVSTRETIQRLGEAAELARAVEEKTAETETPAEETHEAA